MRRSKYFTWEDKGKYIRAFVISKYNGTYIRIPLEWGRQNKDIYITFQDRTELVLKPRLIGHYYVVSIPAIYAGQYVIAQLSESYE